MVAPRGSHPPVANLYIKSRRDVASMILIERCSRRSYGSFHNLMCTLKLFPSLCDFRKYDTGHSIPRMVSSTPVRTLLHDYSLLSMSPTAGTSCREYPLNPDRSESNHYLVFSSLFQITAINHSMSDND